MNYLFKHKTVFIYGSSMAAAMFVMRWLEWRFLVINHAFEIYAGLIALIFTALGIWLALNLSKNSVGVVNVEKTPSLKGHEFVINQSALRKTGISTRELEVLELMASGLSNQEIAARLFLSLSTIKTHLSSVFFKLEVQRRTQAVEKAKQLGLIC